MNSITNNPTTPTPKEVFTLSRMKMQDPLAYYSMLEQAMENYNMVKAQPDASAYAYHNELGELFKAWKKKNNIS